MNFIINRQGKNYNKSPVRYESIFEKYIRPAIILLAINKKNPKA